LSRFLATLPECVSRLYLSMETEPVSEALCASIFSKYQTMDEVFKGGNLKCVYSERSVFRSDAVGEGARGGCGRLFGLRFLAHTHIYICLYTRVCVCVYIYIYIYIYMA